MADVIAKRKTGVFLHNMMVRMKQNGLFKLDEMNTTVDVITEFAHDVESSEQAEVETAVDGIVAVGDRIGDVDSDLRRAFEDLDRVEREMNFEEQHWDLRDYLVEGSSTPFSWLCYF